MSYYVGTKCECPPPANGKPREIKVKNRLGFVGRNGVWCSICLTECKEKRLVKEETADPTCKVCHGEGTYAAPHCGGNTYTPCHCLRRNRGPQVVEDPLSPRPADPIQLQEHALQLLDTLPEETPVWLTARWEGREAWSASILRALAVLKASSVINPQAEKEGSPEVPVEPSPSLLESQSGVSWTAEWTTVSGYGRPPKLTVTYSPPLQNEEPS